MTRDSLELRGMGRSDYQVNGRMKIFLSVFDAKTTVHRGPRRDSVVCSSPKYLTYF